MEHVDLKRCGRRGSDVLHSEHKLIMKSTKVQTLGAVALHTITACTDDASAIVCVLPCLGSVHVGVCTYYSLAPKLGLLLLQY